MKALVLLALFVPSFGSIAEAGFGVKVDGYIKSFDAKSCEFETKDGTLTVPFAACKSVAPDDRAQRRIVSINLSMKEYDEAKLKPYWKKR